jgi:Ser/Thr protein kinase RdoA (MazF antagonist)
MNNNTPYENLDPNLILDAVDSVGFLCSGSLLALNSYENRVYQIGMENSVPMIAKFYRPHRWSDAMILEEHQFALELQDYEIPVVAPWMNNAKETLHHFKGYRFALFPRWGGRAMELDRLDQLEWIGRFIGRLHAVSACRPFDHRPKLDVQTYGYNAYNFLIENNFIPPELKTQYCHTVESLLNIIGERLQSVHYIRLHGDMHAGNVLWDDAGPHIVDLDDCVMGPAVQDMWMLLAGDNELQVDALLRGYREFHDFNHSELYLIEPLRTLRMIHYSAWLARRWEDPTFPQNFPWFNTLNYWHEQVIHLNEQLSRLG